MRTQTVQHLLTHTNNTATNTQVNLIMWHLLHNVYKVFHMHDKKKYFRGRHTNINLMSKHAN